jgi:hypothetical protein
MDIQSKIYPATYFVGRVMEMNTDEAIPFAKVVLTDEKGTYHGAVSDEAGNFTFKDLPLGVYRLRISAVDYIELERVFDVKRHAYYQLAVKLTRHVNQVEKPVIYLYPTAKRDVQVRLNYKGNLIHTYPKYSDEGWQVTAEPDGTLWDQKGQEYYALFWEGIPSQPMVPQNGFVVAGKETAAFLEEKLAYLGLNRKEANEFIMYWLPRMEDNPYNLIHFASEQYEEQAKLVIVPKPDCRIRVMMLTQPLNARIDLPLQELSLLKKVRKGFTMVEWGGAIINTIKKGTIQEQ